MAQEIERKFLVDTSRLPPLPVPFGITQGYLSDDPVVRVRLLTYPSTQGCGFLTIKGPGLLSRAEYEYEIPSKDATELLKLCKRQLRKNRHIIEVDGFKFEVDQFFYESGETMLWMAEIELENELSPFPHPHWLGEEVTLDRAYTNVAIANRNANISPSK